MIMKEKEAVVSRTGTIVLLAFALLAMAASVPALAHGGRSRVSVGVGFGFGFPAYGYYPAPYYYPPPYYNYPQVAVPGQSTVYVERGDSYAPSEQVQGFWYYCPEAKAYYPYVKECAKGWQKVPPTPPGDRP